MRTAVILVTYNGWEMTQACLQDMSAQIEDEEHFVFAIADNGSTDDTIVNIRKHFPKVHLYPQLGNKGFGAANNSAVKKLIADGEDFDTICLLNNDTRLGENVLPNLRTAFNKAQEIAKRSGASEAIISPIMLNVDGSIQGNYFAGLGPEGIGYIQFWKNAFRNEAQAATFLEGSLQETSHPAFKEAHWLSAVCWMISRNLWEATNGFDESIFMYYEDAELALRTRMHGARFYVCTSLVITHLGGGSAKNNLSRALQHDRSQQYVFKKHFGICGLLLSKSFRFNRSLVRILASLPHCFIGSDAKNKRSYVKHHLALLKEVF